jgi:2'-5' RNA ligase
MRTFIAIDPSEEVKDNVSLAIKRLEKTNASVKWVKKENLHITLKFLGGVQEKDIKGLIGTVSGALKGFRSFEMEFEGAGVFPGGSSPRVVWVGAKEGAEKTKDLAQTIDAALSKMGFGKEEREFKSHLTIGRVRDRKNLSSLNIEIEKMKSEEFGRTVIDNVNIVKSTLSPKGPTYEVVKSIKLE